MKTLAVWINPFFITIATVLGTGILALPVKLADSGFTPFFFNYLVCFIMQLAVLAYVVELLQKAKYLLDEGVARRIAARHAAVRQRSERSGLLADDSDDAKPSEDDHLPPDSPHPHPDASHDDLTHARDSIEHGPDLHLLGTLFLGPRFRILFDVCVMLHFVSILISYLLAGAQAYAAIFNAMAYTGWFVAPLLLILGTLVVFGGKVVAPVISGMTFAKGTALVLVVIVTGVIAGATNRDYETHWIFIGKPFLVSTVALGGAANVLPVVFAKVDPIKKEVRGILASACGGLSMVWILNVLWCYFILESVRQYGPAPSLAHSAHVGQIATVPLNQYISESLPDYQWISSAISAFITISVTVSFITMATATKHVLDGFATSWRPVPSTRFILYVATFGLVYIIAQVNPSAFLVVLESVTSFALNLEAGLLVVLMAKNARSLPEYSHVIIPYPLPDWMHTIMGPVVMCYFTMAVVYDFARYGGYLIGCDD